MHPDMLNSQKEPKRRISRKVITEIDNQGSSVIGGFTDQNTIYLIFSSNDKTLNFLESPDAHVFQPTTFILPSQKCLFVQLGSIDQGRFALMNLENRGLSISVSKDLKRWSRIAPIGLKNQSKKLSNGVLIPDYQKDGEYLMLLGGQKIHLATSKDAINWEMDLSQIVEIPVASYQEVQVDLATKLQRGILLCYRLVVKNGSYTRHQVHMALLDMNNPSRVIWRTRAPLFENDPNMGEVSFGGAVSFRSQIYGFWNTSMQGTLRVRYPIEDVPFQMPIDHVISLERARSNPVIFPRSEFHWESFATYNPAAFYADGKVHILYRAQGNDLISSIGYANSEDGIQIDERLENPIYLPQEVFETFQPANSNEVVQKYVSGGGIAGCEDPRVTLIGDRVFMTYVAFDGASPPRVALTSIALDDFLAKRWIWEKPVLISPPGIVDKSAVIFPEKIKGKYVIMHRIFPHIQIDYVDDLNFDGSRWLKEEDRIPIRENMWDSRKIGAGAPPIKTPEGWLLIYYGVDDRDDRQYKMGAMLLDLEDPSRVIYRSSTPVLEPQDWYENSGFKPGILYPCGAVLVNETLHVYYGGADCVVCVASRDLKTFLAALKSNHELNNEKQRFVRISNHETHTKQIKSYSFS